MPAEYTNVLSRDTDKRNMAQLDLPIVFFRRRACKVSESIVLSF